MVGQLLNVILLILLLVLCYIRRSHWIYLGKYLFLGFVMISIYCAYLIFYLHFIIALSHNGLRSLPKITS